MEEVHRLTESDTVPYTRDRMARLAKRRIRFTAFTLLLAAAILVRTLIPLGFMPTEAGRGGAVLRLCTSRAGVEKPIERIRGIPTSPAPAHDERCPFSMAGMLAPPLSLPSVAAVSEVSDPQPAGREYSITVPSVLRAQSPRAPPHSA